MFLLRRHFHRDKRERLQQGIDIYYYQLFHHYSAINDYLKLSMIYAQIFQKMYHILSLHMDYIRMDIRFRQ